MQSLREPENVSAKRAPQSLSKLSRHAKKTDFSVALALPTDLDD